MSRIKHKDQPFINESMLTLFTKKDLKGCSGIKIKNTANTCFLYRYDIDEKINYWAECKLINKNIKELRVLSEQELLDILNDNKSNYILVK